jgi:hypothetical protein
LKEQHNECLDASRRGREISATRKVIAAEYSAAVGGSVVLRVYTGGITSYSFALTTVPFATSDEAHAWVEANKADVTYNRQLPAS